MSGAETAGRCSDRRGDVGHARSRPAQRLGRLLDERLGGHVIVATGGQAGDPSSTASFAVRNSTGIQGVSAAWSAVIVATVQVDVDVRRSGPRVHLSRSGTAPESSLLACLVTGWPWRGIKTVDMVPILAAPDVSGLWASCARLLCDAGQPPQIWLVPRPIGWFWCVRGLPVR